MILTDRTFLVGVVVGVLACYAFHHYAPSRAAMAHGQGGS